MKRKKLFSMAVAGMLVAAQMVMPVSATAATPTPAPGEVDVPVTVTTRTATIRVVVPMSFTVAVNQFEKGDAGSQIYSPAFEMTNRSEIPVKVGVTTKVILPSTGAISLKATKAGVGTDNANGEAWLAAAAQTSTGKYIETVGKGIKDLTGEEKNVATLDATNGAKQTFYLSGPAGAYKGFVPPNANDDDGLTSAVFYKLTVVSGTDQAALDAAIASADVYMVPTADASAVTDVNGDTLALVARKGGSATRVDGVTYFTAAASPSAHASALVATEGYVYSTMNYTVVKSDASNATIAAVNPLNYTKFYKLELLATQTQAGVNEAVKSSDIYEVTNANATDPAANNFTLTVRAGGTATVDVSAKKYYQVAADPVSAIEANTCYVYGESVETGGKAAFRYIGKLSDRTTAWKNTDLGTFMLRYAIEGATTTEYNAAVADTANFINGLYVGTGSGAAASATTVTGASIRNGGGTTTYATGADVATRLKSGAVQFVLASAADKTAATTASASGVTKINIDGTDYTPIGTANSNGHANSDGKTYAITGFSANTVTTILVYYGNSYIVKYTFN